MARVVAICGTAPSSRLLVNQEPPTTERWCQNACRIFVQQIDRFFELHSKQWIYQRLKSPQAFVEYQHWMQHFEGPVYQMDADPCVKTSRRFPLEWLVEKFGIPVDGWVRECSAAKRHNLVYEKPRNAYVCQVCGYSIVGYFTSSIAYMLAMAVDELGPGDQLKLYGCNMNSVMEYAHQRSGCEYYLGWARAKGIDIWLPDSSPILKCFLYGKTEQSPMTVELVEERIRKLKESERRHESELINIRAQIQDNEYWLNVLNGITDPSPIPEGKAVVLTNNGKVPEGILHPVRG